MKLQDPNCKLYIKKDPSKMTNRMFIYLHKNLEKIVSHGLFIDFIIAYPEDAEYYNDEGIKGFPAFVAKNQIYIGYNSIEKFFNQFIQDGDKTEKNDDDIIENYLLSNISNNVSISEDGNLVAKNDEDEDENADARIQKQLNAAMKNRHLKDSTFLEGLENKPNDIKKTQTPAKSTNQPITKPRNQLNKNNTTTLKRQPPQRQPPPQRRNNVQKKIPIGKRNKAGLGTATDDELMSNFFDNQETTNM